jgi:hypothetical protein
VTGELREELAARQCLRLGTPGLTNRVYSPIDLAHVTDAFGPEHLGAVGLPVAARTPLSWVATTALADRVVAVAAFIIDKSAGGVVGDSGLGPGAATGPRLSSRSAAGCFRATLRSARISAQTPSAQSLRSGLWHLDRRVGPILVPWSAC